MRTLYLLAFMICFAFFACNDIEEGPIDHDGTAPGPISNVQIQRQPGGATLIYEIPDDPDFLCVEASYKLADGIEKKIRSSYHSRSVVVEGFADTSEYVVTLTGVDRSENRSQPVEVTFRPMTPSVISVFKTIYMEPDFGGIHMTWKNPDKAALAIFISVKDSIGEDKILDTYYTSSEEGDYTSRGMDTITQEFTVQVRDRWNNYSEKKIQSLTPIYETLLDRTKFRSLGQDYASESVKNFSNISRLWDNNFRDNAMTSSTTPWYASWDLGVTARLSRIVIWQYAWPGNKTYGHYYAGHNMRKCKVYGTNTPEVAASWIELRECEIIKKSGLPIGYGREFMSDEDFSIARDKGHEFTIPLDKPAIRYFRLESTAYWENPMGTPAEIHFYGDPRSQN